MTRIFKYLLAIEDEQTVEMPEGASPLTAQIQRSAEMDGLFLWAVVNPDNPKRKYRVRIVGTGNPFDDAAFWFGGYVGTVQDGDFVWHVFVR